MRITVAKTENKLIHIRLLSKSETIDGRVKWFELNSFYLTEAEAKSLVRQTCRKLAGRWALLTK